MRDEQYLVGEDQKVQIIDEFTGRIMADRSWRHGLHQAIEVKESVPVTADKENLARPALWTVVGDTGSALLAGFAIIPAVLKRRQ